MVRARARVVVLTRDPTPGRVKTRLVPALGAGGAARLHEALALHTVGVALASGLPVVVALDGARAGPFAEALRRAGAVVVPQGAGDLGARMAAATSGPGRHVLVGSDCPGLQADDLVQAAATPGLCLGPAVDGGYWLVALDGAPAGRPNPAHAIFERIPWSTDRVLRVTLERARAAGLEVRTLTTRADLDLPQDLAALAADPTCPPALLPLLVR
ncbi:TIGR04282 family arsenosugar biosynthesis glycosyltransferase [Myxococcota bacterium]|nr:TIGR04282 family arsenosugar biosynthesis glycosyltransferase [Myxococcota bacterium]